MIYKGLKDISELHHGRTNIMEVYYGKKLIWELANSCYGSGYWINERPWRNDGAWKNI